jgi:hypothetical protein
MSIESNTKKVMKIVAIASIIMVFHDTIGSFASVVFRFPIWVLYPISSLIWGTAGFFASRTGNLKSGILTGGILGAIDATLGWTISSAIHGNGPKNLGQIISNFLFITLFAALHGLIGGFLQGRKHQYG